MKAIIIAGGTPPTKNLIIKELTADSIIIAADSGADCLKKYKITPDYLIGDFDSIAQKTLDYCVKNNTAIEQHPCNKDLTDGQLALKKALALKAKKIIFLGCLGGARVDHLWGAIGLLAKCTDLNIDAAMKDEHQTLKLLKKSTIISGSPGSVFSLQAYGNTVKNLSIAGSKYPLHNYPLKMGDALTLSNEFLKKKVAIQFKSGRLLLILQINTLLSDAKQNKNEH